MSSARFSYLGLVADGHGIKDAGTGGVTGSLNLFDVEDAVPIGSRGIPIISAASAGGRLVVASPQMVGVIYGSGHATWRFDQLDDERGSIVGRGMVEADGIAYWMSNLGPCRYAGGGKVDPIERRIKPRIADIYVATSTVPSWVTPPSRPVSTFPMQQATLLCCSMQLGGGIVYVEAGALKYRGTAGTITTIAAA